MESIIYLEIIIDENKNLYVSSIMPECIEIKKSRFGYGVFAKKKFKKGEIVYKQESVLMNGNDFNEGVIIGTNIGKINVNKSTHFAKYREKFDIYSFDCFTNHSCDPNTSTSFPTEEETYFMVEVIREIQEGEEILVDYNQFYTHDQDSIFMKCECGSKICKGNVITGSRI